MTMPGQPPTGPPAPPGRARQRMTRRTRAIWVTAGVAAGLAALVAAFVIFRVPFSRPASAALPGSSSPAAPGTTAPAASSKPARHHKHHPGHHHKSPGTGGSAPGAPPAGSDPTVPASGTLFGAYVQPTGGTTLAAEESAVTGLEHNLGRKLAIDHMYARFTSPLPISLAQWNLSEGRIPMISWSYEYTSKIAAGDYDSLIRADARQLKALHGPVLLRWFAEMDNAQSRPYVASPASYIAAWRHMVDIFRHVGARNVHWVWCPGSGDFGPGIAQRYYPGNAYVDWIGADGYNWAPVRPNTPWRSFAQIFASFYHWGIATGKPLMIGEYGAVEGAPGQKATWFRQAATQLRTEFPAIRAVVYFDDEHQNFGQDFNWRVTTSASALAAFREFAAESFFTARAATTAAADRPGA
jgi:hypothetical protein